MSDRKRTKKGKSKALTVAKVPATELTEAEAAEYEEAKRALGSFPRRAKIKLENKVLKVGAGKTETLDGALLQVALGSESSQVANHLIHRIAQIIPTNGNDDADTGAIANAFALLASIAPQNELETNMAVQMVATNEAMLFCFRRMEKSEHMEQASAYSNMANKAARTFAMQVEALQKLRRGGEQVVRHVHVNEGGQAVIANTVTTGGRGG